MHGGVVDQGSFVEVDVDAIVGLELQGGLDARFGEEGLRKVLADGIVEIPADFAEARTGVIVFLRVVVAWYPPSRVVACHGELGAFFRNDEVIELALLREFVTQSEAIVIDAETDVHVAVFGCLGEAYQQFVVVVAYLAVFAPNGCPRLVESRAFFVQEGKAVEQVSLSVKVIAQAAGQDNRFTLKGDTISRHGTLQLEVDADRAVGRRDFARLDGKGDEEEEKGEEAMGFHLF